MATGSGDGAARVLATLGLGSNLGEREQHLAVACSALRNLPHTDGVDASRVFETDPVGGPPQGPYLHAVVRIRTGLAARALLESLLEIERLGGRERGGPRFGPRSLDLDLLLYGDNRVDEVGLQVPHPRLPQRRFVLAPLCDLAAAERHPVLGDSFAELLRKLPDDPAGVRVIDGLSL